METKSRNEILLEEKVDKIDDINFDKIYNIEEISNVNLNNFDDNIVVNRPSSDKKQDESFSIEIQPNEFLDTFKMGQEANVMARKKEKVNNKALIFTFTSIMALLCILFIYNMFVINSLSFTAGQASATNGFISSTIQETQENNNITFANSNKIEIERYDSDINENDLQSNWFDNIIDGLNKLFGGKY